MRSFCNMTFEPAGERGGPWGRDLFTFVTSAACHMMRTLQKPRKNRPSKRQVNHRRFLHNMIQRKFAEIEAANHQLASALFSSSRPNNQLDPPSPTQPTNNLPPELSKEGVSAASPQAGAGVSGHEEACELWVLDADDDTTRGETDAPALPPPVPHSHQRPNASHGETDPPALPPPVPHRLQRPNASHGETDAPALPPPVSHSLQRLNASHGTSPAGENRPPDQVLKPCQALNQIRPQQSEPPAQEDHSEPASAGLEGLSSMLAMNELWLGGTRTLQRTSSSSLPPPSPNVSRELLMASSDAAVFDFVSSLLAMSPPSLETCDFGISELTGQDLTPHHRPSPPPDNPPMDLSTGLDLLDSEEEGSDQNNGQDSQITMATPWSVYFDGESPFGMQGDGAHLSTSTQSSSCITKNLVSFYGDQDGGPYLCATSNSHTHTANTSPLSPHLQLNSLVVDPANTSPLTPHLQVNSLVVDPFHRADDRHDDRDITVTRPSGPLHHVNQLSPHGPCRTGYEDEPEERCFPDEGTHLPPCDTYSPFSAVPSDGCSYYQTRSSCNVVIKDPVGTLSTGLSTLSAEAFWVDVTKGALKANPGSQLCMQDEVQEECPREDASMHEDYVADSVAVLSSFRSAVSDDVFQPQHVATSSAQTAGYPPCSQQVSGSGSSLPVRLPPPDCAHSTVCSTPSSCMKDDSALIWSSSPSPPECSTPFAGVAVSFPAPAQQPRPCQVLTPPLAHDLLFNDIVEEEMGVIQTRGLCGLH